MPQNSTYPNDYRTLMKARKEGLLVQSEQEYRREQYLILENQIRRRQAMYEQYYGPCVTEKERIDYYALIDRKYRGMLDEKNALYPERVRAEMDRVRALIDNLRELGVSEESIGELMRPARPLSRLYITSDYRIYLPEYGNAEVTLGPLPKAVFILFFRHPGREIHHVGLAAGDGHQQGVDHAEGRGHGIHKRGHVGTRGEARVGHFAQRAHGTVRDGDDLRVPVARETHGVQRAGGIAREGDADQDIVAPDIGNGLEDIGIPVGDKADIFKDEMEIIAQELRQGGSGTEPHDIDGFGGQKTLHHCVENIGIQLFQRGVEILHIGLEDRGKHGMGVDIGSAAETFVGGQPMGNQFLQAALQLGIAFIAHGGGKTDHGGLTDTDLLGQTRGGHKYGLVAVGGNVVGDPPVALAQLVPALVQAGHHIL